jgi:hypothetical protein
VDNESQEHFQERCTNCGQPMEPGDKFCKNCGQPFAEHRSEEPPSLQPPIPPVPPQMPPIGEQPPLGAPPPSDGKYVAWEDRQKVGFFEGMWQTWQESVFNPEKFYSHLPSRGGLGNPLLYALIILWIGTIIDQAYKIIFSGFFHGLMSRFMPSSELPNLFALRTGLSFINMIIAPIFIIMGLFILSGIYHLIFMIFGWAKRDFEATFRAVAYSAGPAILFIVPFCGSIVGWVWSAVLTIIGLKIMQETTGGKAALVYFLPAILCCCFICIAVIVILIIFGATFFSSFGHIFQNSYGQ